MATMSATMSSESADYPVHLQVQYPEGGKRWMILVRWLLAIPHLAIIYVFNNVSNVITLIALFAILFTRKYPEGLFKLQLGIQRWSQNVWAYVLFHDQYPPFSFEDGEYPPVRYTVERQEQYARFMPLIKWLLAIPHYLVLIFLIVGAAFAYLWTWVVVLATGRYPQGPFNYLVGVQRWGARVSAYVGLMVDQYPPFSLK
ncbi:MAG: DUF4389 domain-containing protein [Dehalococcoidia bacterium]|nr:DUF4389 domain-containing protein [Dehalococcoidia bacterium]